MLPLALVFLVLVGIPASGPLTCWWAASSDHFQDVEQGSTFIFDDDEPVGQPTNSFPQCAGSATLSTSASPTSWRHLKRHDSERSARHSRKFGGRCTIPEVPTCARARVSCCHPRVTWEVRVITGRRTAAGGVGVYRQGITASPVKPLKLPFVDRAS